MLKITVQVDGMMCGMCEAHVNDAVRRAFPVKKVTSSHSKGQTVIITENDMDEAALRAAIGATGYEVKAVSKEPYRKKGLFGFGRQDGPGSGTAGVWHAAKKWPPAVFSFLPGKKIQR